RQSAHVDCAGEKFLGAIVMIGSTLSQGRIRGIAVSAAGAGHRRIGFARTVLLCAALGYVWTEAVRDLVLSRHLIQVQGIGVEANTVAQSLVWHCGQGVLLPFKAGALSVFTV